MSNPFIKRKNYEPKLKRNKVDLSHYNNGTWKPGYIYPIMWELMHPGESIRVEDISCGIRTMPMVFPVQTPIKVRFYAFNVRLRTLMTDFQDWFGGNKPDVVPPYIAQTPGWHGWKTGDIMDYLSVPTTLSSDYSQSVFSHILPFNSAVVQGQIAKVPSRAYSSNTPSSVEGNFIYGSDFGNAVASSGNQWNVFYPLSNKLDLSGELNFSPTFNFSGSTTGYSRFMGVFLVKKPDADFFSADSQEVISFSYGSGGTLETLVWSSDIVDNLAVVRNISLYGETLDLDSSYSLVKNMQNLLDYADRHGLSVVLRLMGSSASAIVSRNPDWPTSSPASQSVAFSSGVYQFLVPGTYDVHGNAENPFSGAFEEPEFLSAFPLRAYEGIVNSYFRNEVVDPFYINGEPQYNRYVTNLGNGPDTTDYHLALHNWESDHLTSCDPTPQLGVAPLVGITSAGDITLQKEDGDLYTVHVNTDDQGVPVSFDLATAQGTTDGSVRRRLVDMATSGISINAFRDTNALQRYKEALLRNGRKFRDQIGALYGVKPSFNELDMPEFLGGYSQMIQVDPVIQTTGFGDSNSALGSYAGLGHSFGRNRHSITHYADEPSIFMVLMVIQPKPVYTQTLSRQWLIDSPLSFFSPQFGHIGMQSVTLGEVAPLQVANSGTNKKLTDTFGYQRPWYQFLEHLDEAHGLMRTQLRNYLFNRQFTGVPELSPSFIKCDPAQLNDPFVVNDDSNIDDMFLGQVYLGVKKKSIVPLYGISRLEA